ncbi:hypothetical protein [Cocleimonas flava]|uniref:Uncharacterized protein n=1 Tax=Cocleimonas flava TaxID=634765 RepID=A0A4R1EZJ7_9GAMM|nr:hypothetical protein [Cocleimonas flava]TCJ86913.1 hypothetical protein EV695_1413 [Cocleimonas flava]
MKKELYTHFVYLSNFYKTTELKIYSSNYLEINEISLFGSVHKKINLTDTYIKTKNTLPNKKIILIIALLFISAISAFSLSQFNLNNKTVSLVLLLASASIILTTVFHLITYSSKRRHSLIKSSSDELLYKFDFDLESSSNSEELNVFTVELQKRISGNDALDTYVDISHKCSNTEEQYNNLLYHLECLYNSGVIDDTTFDRIDSNINEKLYPNLYKDPRHVAEVIYLYNK